MNISARRTGRTTRMLMDALGAARSGRRVLIVAHDSRQVFHLREALFDLVGPTDVTITDGETAVVNIEIMTATRANLDWRRMEPDHNPEPGRLTLVDHATIEVRYGTMLEMLHRYDLENPPGAVLPREEPPSLPPVGERRLKLGRKQ